MAKVKVLTKITIILTVLMLMVSVFLPFNISFAKSRQLTVFVGEVRYDFYGEEIGVYKGELYLKNQDEIIEGIYFDTIVRPQNAKVKLNDNQNFNFEFQQEKWGKEIDKNKLKQAIIKALNSGKSQVYAEFIQIQPKITVNDLKQETLYRAEFSTYYSYSSEGRKHNIMLATQKINGTVLKPNQEFSFNKAVGERTLENGFENAKIIVGGEFADGIGGGVCQVSTTLYNCALLSGLKITEQHPHSLAVSYVEPSFDAMVNSLTSDLKFVNTTNKNVYIRAVADGNKLTFKIFGEKQREKYQRVSVIKKEILPKENVIIEDPTLPFGTKTIIQNAKNGVVSEGYLIKYINGSRISNIKIRNDSYSAVKEKILLGTLEDALTKIS